MNAEEGIAGSTGTRNAITGGGEKSSADTRTFVRGRAIFLSYRRDDTEGEAGRLYDDLARAYGDSSVFMDVAGIQPGLDFRKAIDENVASCGVLLAVIGPTWATITSHDGTRRLDNPADYVRLEVSSALKRGIPVIPVLVHEARMPALEQLPDDLKDLRYRNSVELTHARWRSDVDLFIAALKPYVGPKPARPEATVHATVPVQLPAPQAKAPAAKPRGQFGIGLALGALAVVAVLAGFFFFVLRPRWQERHRAADAASTTPATQAVSASDASSQKASPTVANTTGTTTSIPTLVTPTTITPVAAPTATSVPPALIGRWKITGTNPANSDRLEQLEILQFSGKFIVRAYGTCPGKPCDWGERSLTMDGGFAITREPWEPRNLDVESKSQRRVSVSLALQGDTLVATVKNQSVEGAKSPFPVLREAKFKKAQ